MAEAVTEHPTETTTPGSSYTQDDITVESNHAPLETLKEAFEQAEVVTPAEPVRDTRERNTDGTFKEAPKPRNRRDDPSVAVQSAIAKQREAERRAEAAETRARDHEAELQRLRTTPPAAQEPTKQPTVSEWQRFRAMPDAPKLDAFDTIEDYNFAVSMFVADKRLEERSRQDQQRQQFDAQAKTLTERATKFSERMQATTTADPTFLERVDPRLLNLVPISALPPGHAPTFGNAVAEVFVRSDNPAALMDYLSTHPDAVQRLSTLPPEDFFREMGKLEYQLGTPAAPVRSGPAPAPRVSTAKPLIQPVSTSPHAPDSTELTDDLDPDEFIRRGNALDRKAGRL